MNHALLVGINRYQNLGISHLQGCENDVDLLAQWLAAKDDTAEAFNVKRLTSEEATRANLIAGFQKHLSQAKPGELALFYFSGHGSRRRSPEVLHRQQPDKYHENLVCHDSLTDEEPYQLADKELKFLIKQLTDKGIEVVCFFDCCHSGSGTRLLVNARSIPDLHEVRPAESFLKGALDPENLNAYPPHHLLAACAPTELSLERRVGFGGEEKFHGMFTLALIQTLRQSSFAAGMSYALLTEAVRERVATLLPREHRQTPRLEVSGGTSGRSYFLQHARLAGENEFVLSWSSVWEKWVVNLGLIHGLGPGEQASFQVLGLKPGQVFGQAYTHDLGVHQSPVDVDFDPEYLFSSHTYQLKSLHLPFRPLLVYDREQVFDPEQVFAALPAENRPPAFSVDQAQVAQRLQLVSSPEAADYQLRKLDNGEVSLEHSETGEPLLPPTYLFNAQLQAEALVQVAKWEQFKALQNPRLERWALQEKVQLVFQDEGQAHAFSQPHVTLDMKPGQAHDFSLEIHTEKEDQGFVRAYYLSRYYQVIFLPNEGRLPQPGHPLRLLKNTLGLPVKAAAMPEQIFDRFLVIISETELPYLEVTIKDRLSDRLCELSQKFQKGITCPNFRDMGFERDLTNDKSSHWFTRSLCVKGLRQLGEVGAQPLALPDYGLSVGAHPHLRGALSLSSSAKHLEVPESDFYLKLMLQARGFELLTFQAADQLTLIELHHLHGQDRLATQPLQLQWEGDLAPGERLLALTLPPDLEPDALAENPGFAPVLGWWEPVGPRSYQLSLTHCPANPDDGRAEPGHSLKIGTARIPEARVAEVAAAVEAGWW